MAMNRAIKTGIAIAVCLVAAVVAWPQASDDPLDSLKVLRRYAA
jgi:hypothetical protein